MRCRSLLLVSSICCAPALAEEPCTDFLENHPNDPAAERACIEWLEALESPQLGSSGFSSMTASQEGSCSHPVPLHLFSEAFEEPSVDDPLPVDLAEGNQREPFLAADPNGAPGAQRLFAVAFTDPTGGGLLASRSDDSGASWLSKPLAAGNDGLPVALADPWAVFTEHGTLFVSYLFDTSSSHPDILADTRPTVIAMSTDGGDTFEFVDELGADQAMTGTDRGSMATGPGGTHGTLWAVYRDSAGGIGPIVVAGAALDANGEVQLDACGPDEGSFCTEEVIGTSDAPGHIAVGPDGEVLATFIRNGIPPEPPGDTGVAEIFALLDPDGLGPLEFADPCPPFEPAGSSCTYPVTITNQRFLEGSAIGAISPLANLSWNRSSGRVYLVTTSQTPQGSLDHDIELWYSDDVALESWQGPIRVNQDGTTHAQVLPHVDVNESTGVVAVAWYDLRNDDGSGGSGGGGGTDSSSNNEYELFVATALDGVAQGAPAFTDRPLVLDIACLPAFSMPNSVLGANPRDYLGVAALEDGVAAVWADNSNSAGDNDSNDCVSLPCMDIYVPEPRGWMQLTAGACGLRMASRARRRTGTGGSLNRKRADQILASIRRFRQYTLQSQGRNVRRTSDSGR